MPDALILKIVLNGSEPLIWRRIIVATDHNFFELHHIFQISMGWKNYHLYEFNIEGFSIGDARSSAKAGFKVSRQLEAREVQLNELINEKGEQFMYRYDYGDDWQHEVTVESIFKNLPTEVSVLCASGKMACPPEDAGGIDAYTASMEILRDKQHPEYKGVSAWYGRGFDPQTFDVDLVNRQLKQLKQYIKKWENGDSH